MTGPGQPPTTAIRYWSTRLWIIMFATTGVVAFSQCGQGSGPDSSETDSTPRPRNGATGSPTQAPPPADVAEAASPLTTTSLGVRQGSSPTLFTDLTSDPSTGIEFQNTLPSDLMRRYMLNGAGLCVGDYDGDGRPDLFLISQEGPNQLYRQVQDFVFEDVTESAGLADDHAWGTGATFADIDNDGDLDLYVCNINAANMLYVNQGDGTFVESAAMAGVAHPGATTMAAFADYDCDGDLDLYLLNNRVFSVAEEHPRGKIRMIDGQMTVHPDYKDQYFIIAGRLTEAGQRDLLFENNGGGTFRDVTDQAGIAGYDMGLSATWWDYNNDGWLDLYIANDLKSPDHLYRNQGDGSFVDVIAEVLPHTPWFSMGSDFADLNGDGQFDLAVADMSSTTHFKQKTTMGEMSNSAWFLSVGTPRQVMRNAVYLSTKSDHFMEAANLTGLDSTDWTWSIRFGDLDNDGLEDAFITNGVARNMNDSDQALRFGELVAAGRTDEARNMILQLPPLKEDNLAFRNLGDLQFENVAKSWGLNHNGVSQGAVMADLDRDGDLDVIVNHMNEPIGVYRNDGDSGTSILVTLRGSQSNTFGIGARIEVETDLGQHIRQVIPARGYMSSGEPVTHFGFGEATAISRLTVRWPSGVVQEFTDLETGQLFTITEPDRGADKPAARSGRQLATTPIFDDVTDDSGLSFRHVERPYNDYAREPLLPNKMSQFGPGLAWADVDDDGDQDVFFGGASGQSGQLYLGDGVGRYTRAASGPWTSDLNAEDMGILFFDADSDGDSDLYVVSGGVECEPGSDRLRDRLYLNDGSGGFHPAAPDTLPDIRDSGSCVVAADFDRDGDLDLFVGGRVIPGQYPLAAQSRLLINNDGRFSDQTSSLAPSLVEPGLVTGAMWSDADGDGWVDLLVTLEWGPVMLLKNRTGQLVNETLAAGLSTHTGWWNSVSGADIDHDGDIDYVIGNVGLNTKYQATPDHPATIYLKDFDGNGTLDLVEAEWEGDTCYPIRGRSCSSNAMPFIRDKFGTFNEFARAPLANIYTPPALAASNAFLATRLDHVVLINDGTGRFDIVSLPRLAQASPVFGSVMQDFDGDGHADIAVVQNFMEPQVETGQMDGGLGLLLVGDGEGGFAPVAAGESGIRVPEQGMGLSSIDLNQDGWPDLVLTTNNGPVRAYRSTGSASRMPLAIVLEGALGSRSGVGSRITVRTRLGRTITREVLAGSGYLSQSGPEVYLSLAPGDAIESITVRWPDGSESTHARDGEGPRLTISKP